jgi:hypothetical protein
MTWESHRRWALVFAIMRRKRRSARMKSELGQGVEHFKRAAALAAQETGSTVGPKWNATRGRVQPAVSQAKGAASTGWGSAVATLAPLVTAAADNVRQTGKTTKKVSKADKKADKKQAAKNAKKLQKRADKAVGRKRGKGGKLFGLALVGAAVGAGAAYAAKRRQAAQWDEYDPSAPISSADSAAYEPTGSTTALDPTVVPTTGTTGTTATTGTSSSTGTTSTTGTTGTDADPTVVTGSTDQTASHQHSDKVARMAGGQTNTED